MTRPTTNMDSRLLNAFHDDHFDGNYGKYETDGNFWSTESEPMGFQLTETLHGILPISPTDNANSFFKIEGDNLSEIDDDYYNSNSNEVSSGEMGSQGIEIISVDPNANCDSFSENDSSEEDDDDDDGEQDERFSFRSRTDSSSIGDYESHSSDYDDDDDDVDDYEYDALCAEKEHFNGVPGRSALSFMIEDQMLLKSGPIDVNISEKSATILEDDALGLNLGDGVFDLAEFITQDDLKFDKAPAVPEVTAKHELTTPVVSDNDSDIEVDVETVEIEESVPIKAENDIEYVDNMSQDPSWDPLVKSAKVTPSPSKQNKQPNFNRNFSIVPSKRQCALLKGKFGLGRGKNLSMHQKPKPTISKAPSIGKKSIEAKSVETKPAEEKPKEPEPNLNIEPMDIETPTEVTPATAAPVKRKLNLEEYKRRRENPQLSAAPAEVQKRTEPSKAVVTSAPPPAPVLPNQTVSPVKSKPKPEIISAINNLKQDANNKLDPITEAKKRVLRLQELKKAQQIKIIDSTVSAKTGRVTKLPPLKDIVKDSYLCTSENDESVAKPNPYYDEIIIVSASCNTEITIPPKFSPSRPMKTKGIVPSPRSLLKSSALLFDINNTMHRVQTVENVKISSNSLLSSIQDVVVKTTTDTLDEAAAPTTADSATEIKPENKRFEHGEDKIIMHLPKNRLRQRQYSMSTQTEPLPEFPPLPVPAKADFNNKDRANRGRRKYRSRHPDQSQDESSHRSRSRSRSLSRSVTNKNRRYSSRKYSRSSSDSESDYHDRSRSREPRKRKCSISSTRSNSSTSSSSQSRSKDRFSNRSSRSRSGSRPTSRSSQNYRGAATSRGANRNVSQPAVEERRIVYVGRIEAETTKEDLRRKFIAYGPIRQVTVHYKDTGMKYGFVTFEKAQDAFQVIDSGTRDPEINMYDISFGGRRAFCRSSYADLDNAIVNSYTNNYLYAPVVNKPKEDDSFEALLKQVKAKLVSTKSQSKT